MSWLSWLDRIPSKALIAFTMGLSDLLDIHFGWHLPGVSEEGLATIFGILGTIGVWLMPDRSAS